MRGLLTRDDHSVTIAIQSKGNMGPKRFTIIAASFASFDVGR
jgi:hypothetical protein